MEDIYADAINFDFECDLDAGHPNPPAPAPLFRPDIAGAGYGGANSGGFAGADPTAGSSGGMRSFRQTVCRHWLRGLCMKGEKCGFLHQYDKSKMPVCRFFKKYGECREQECVYKHTTEEIKECKMYSLGFCPNGPYCRYKHTKLPGPPPPPEEVFRRLQQQQESARYSHNRNAGYPRQAERHQFPQGPNSVNQDATATEYRNMQQG